MDQSTNDRITRLEESQAFGERTLEQLHDEVLTLGRRVEALTARLAKAEAALAERSGGGQPDAETDGALEVPPHSHMPLDRDAGRTTDPFFRPASGAEPPEGLR